MRPLAIFGTGGLGRETAWLAQEVGRTLAGYLDDDPAKAGLSIGTVPVIGNSRFHPPDVEIVVAVGNPRVRRSIVRRLNAGGAAFATLVHPAAAIGPRVTIGAGSILPAGSIVTCDSSIGSHCVIGAGCIISHDCRLDDFVTLAPAVALPGNTNMQAGSEVAIGATMRQQLIIGRGAMLGMGAVLNHDIPGERLWFGTPARDVRAMDPWDEA